MALTRKELIESMDGAGFTEKDFDIDKVERSEAAWVFTGFENGSVYYFEAHLSEDEHSPNGYGWTSDLYETDLSEGTLHSIKCGRFWGYQNADELESVGLGFLPFEYQDKGFEATPINPDLVWEMQEIDKEAYSFGKEVAQALCESTMPHDLVTLIDRIEKHPQEIINFLSDMIDLGDAALVPEKLKKFMGDGTAPYLLSEKNFDSMLDAAITQAEARSIEAVLHEISKQNKGGDIR